MNAKCCPKCHQYYTTKLFKSIDYCWCCECDTEAKNISCKDVDTLNGALPDLSFENLYNLTEAMIALKEKDIIEYELKMSQFRNQANQQEQAKEKSKPSNQPKCPRCGSTSITAGQRGYSLIWGFLGSGNTVNRCSNCGNKWKP